MGRDEAKANVPRPLELDLLGISIFVEPLN
jgi:hypothetical protein